MSKYNKFLLTRTRKGLYDITNPISPNNLLPIGNAPDILVGDYLPLSGGEMSGNITINYSGMGIIFGTGETTGYIRRNPSEGQIDFGSDNYFNFYDTNTNELAVQISTQNKVINAINGFEWNGQSLDDRYDRYGAWKLFVNGVEKYSVVSNSIINLKGGGATTLTYTPDGEITFSSTDSFANNFGFNDFSGNLTLSGNGTQTLTSNIKIYDHRVHGLGTTSTINGIGRLRSDGVTPITSFNQFYQAGFHTADVGTNYTDGPYPQGGASRGAIINFNSHSTGVTQFFSNRHQNELWYRDSYGGWKPWVKIWDSGNLTSLSQLTNDLDIATSNHTHSWISITDKPALYNGWRLGVGDGTFANIGDNNVVTLQGDGGTSVTRSGNVITISSTNEGGSDGNNYLSGVGFGTTTGDFTFNRLGLTSIVQNIDGRYSLLNHTHSQYEPTFVKNTAFNKNFGLGFNQVLMGEKYTEWLVANLTSNTTLSIPAEIRPMGYYVSSTSTDYTITLDKNNALNHFKVLNTGTATISLQGTSGTGFNTIINVAEGISPQILPGGTAFFSFASYTNISGTQSYKWNVTGDLVGSVGGTDTGGGTADGNNYPTFLEFEQGVLTMGRNGLSSINEDLSDSTLDVNASRVLNANDNGKTLICTASVTLTIPLGLPTSFSVNILNEGSAASVVTIVANGVTLKAPHGAKLLYGYTCNIMKRTANSTFYLQGELTV